MADDRSQRFYRSSSNEAPARNEQGGVQGSPSGNDPLAELARLIGQSDPFGEYARQSARQQAAQVQPEPAAEWGVSEAGAGYAAQTLVPEQQAAAGAEPRFYAADVQEPGYQTDYGAMPGHEADPYYANAQYAAGEHDFYDDLPPARRRTGVLVIAGVFALAVLGTAGAFGYRAIFGTSGTSGPPPVIKADATPSKIVPASAAKDASAKLITDRVNDRAQDEKLVSREEKPVDIKDRPPEMLPSGQVGMPPGSAPLAAPAGSGVIAAEPKKIRTIAIHPDGVAVADAAAAEPVPSAEPAAAPPLATLAEPARAETPPAPPPQRDPPPRPVATRPAPVAHHAAPAPRNAPLSLNPNAPTPHAAAPMRTASVGPTRLAPPAATAARTGGYAVQVTSRRSEADAQAAFHALQGKYPNQLGGRQPMIHRVDLGAKGIYYRAMVGPFASSGEASQLCASLKAAGGQCIIQRN